jgi:hypothetical protein
MPETRMAMVIVGAWQGAPSLGAAVSHMLIYTNNSLAKRALATERRQHLVLAREIKEDFRGGGI